MAVGAAVGVDVGEDVGAKVGGAVVGATVGAAVRAGCGATVSLSIHVLNFPDFAHVQPVFFWHFRFFKTNVQSFSLQSREGVNDLDVSICTYVYCFWKRREGRESERREGKPRTAGVKLPIPKAAKRS